MAKQRTPPARRRSWCIGGDVAADHHPRRRSKSVGEEPEWLHALFVHQVLRRTWEVVEAKELNVADVDASRMGTMQAMRRSFDSRRPVAELAHLMRARVMCAVRLADVEDAVYCARWCARYESGNVQNQILLALVYKWNGRLAQSCQAWNTALQLARPGTDLHRCISAQLSSQLSSQLRPLVPHTRTFFCEVPIGDLWPMHVSSSAGRPCNYGMKFNDMPYVVTLPAASMGDGVSAEIQGTKFPLVVYLHSAGAADISKGNIPERQTRFVAEEAPFSNYVEKGLSFGCRDFIGVAPCCPTNWGALNPYIDKAHRKWKMYWFKMVECGQYNSWQFEQALRIPDLEALVLDWLAFMVEQLPVDPAQIHFVGSSGGGYGVLRLAELCPRLPVSVVSFSGYYPVMPSQDHNPEVLVDRLAEVPCVWPLHSKRDVLCRIESPHVAQLFSQLEGKGRIVEWVADTIARGSTKNYHCACNYMYDVQQRFWTRLLEHSRETVADAPSYLRGLATDIRSLPGQLRQWSPDTVPAAGVWVKPAARAVPEETIYEV